jgi:hypothetical protein
MKIEKVEVYGFRAALRGMRNPMNSWAKSDTAFGEERLTRGWDDGLVRVAEDVCIGPKDMELALSLVKAGGAHRKFLRQIAVMWDITIPRAIWQEYDTYKVATVRNSCSTMHKLGLRDLEPCDIESFDEADEEDWHMLRRLNKLAADYREEKTAERLHKLKMRLPEGFLQKATYSFNYETALKMWFDRHNHKMPEWSGPEGICDWIMRLPYMGVFIESMQQAKQGSRG